MVSFDGTVTNATEVWTKQSSASINISSDKPKESIEDLKIRYPDRPWGQNPTHQISLKSHKSPSKRKILPPPGITFEEIHAATEWIQYNQWTPRHDEYHKRPYNSNILHYQCT